MADDSWHKVREIFERALRHKPDERPRFLNEVCGDDKSLFAEVESLLASHDRAESFMETPAIAQVAEMIEPETRKLERGSKFGHYEIIDHIGEGGMGEVYLAKDARLERKTAIKILPGSMAQDRERMQRFVREAKSASALNHPNIITIYEIGETDSTHFIAIEHIDGETLRERLEGDPINLKSALDIAVQVVSALDAAHRAGIVHRDIKPENVMIRPDGVVKVLDFGIAKLIEKRDEVESEAATVKAQTRPGMIIGTAAYMSPEQARGKAVDARSDIFSFGVMLYEILAGKPPFDGGTAIDTIGSILNKEPVPLSQKAEVPHELERIINKALRKDREERYQTAKDLLIDLKDVRQDLDFQNKLERTVAPDQAAGRTQTFNSATSDFATHQTSAGFIIGSLKRHKPLAAFVALAFLMGAIGLAYYYLYGGKPASSVGNKKSIAVLPFKPLNVSSRDEALEMGMAQTLITRLSNLNQIVVRPMSAVRQYSDVQQDAIKAGQELQTEVVLDGSIQKAGERVRVTVRLINTNDGTSLWSEQFDEDFTDIFKMQDSIAERITSALSLRLSRQEREQLAKRYTNNPEAYQLYLQGEYLWLNRRKENLAEQTLDYYQRALEKDSQFALAYIGIAGHYIRESVRRISGREAETKAISNIMKALEIDPNLAEAHMALAELKYQYEYDWSGAEKDFKKAIELNPNVATIRLAYAWFLMSATRFDEAAIEMEKAREFDPSSLTGNMARGKLLYFTRQYDKALEHFQKIIAVEPTSPGSHLSLAQIYQQKQMYPEFFEELMTHQGLTGVPQEETDALRKAFKQSGYRGFCQKMLDIYQTRALTSNVPPFGLARYNTYLGQKDEAFSWLEKSFDRRDPLMAQLKINPEFDSLREDPRFQDLLRRIGPP